jgi:large subunit ribosomal protein L28
MAKRCDLTGIGAQTGNKVSHSNHKSKRRFVPNLQNISFLSNVLNQKVSLKVTSATLRTVDHNGGLDSYLLGTSNLKLTAIAQKIKRKIKKALLIKETPESSIVQDKKFVSKRPEKVKRPAKKNPADKKVDKIIKGKTSSKNVSAATKAPAKKVAAKKA